MKGELVIIPFGTKELAWRTVATNGNILAGSTEGYHNLTDMQQSLVTSTAIQFAHLSPVDRDVVLRYAERVDAHASNPGDGLGEAIEVG